MDIRLPDRYLYRDTTHRGNTFGLFTGNPMTTRYWESTLDIRRTCDDLLEVFNGRRPQEVTSLGALDIPICGFTLGSGDSSVRVSAELVAPGRPIVDEIDAEPGKVYVSASISA
jgi:hypothetical protein